MRISSNTLYDSNVASLNQQQTQLLKTQQQVSSGRRVLTPADDPVAAARILDIAQADAMNSQYASNRTTARHTVSLAESTLQGVTTLIEDVRTALVSAGNSSMTDAERQAVATNLSGRLEELIGLANSTDGTGNYLFSGFQSKTQPFTNTAAGMGYFGDDGTRMVQVSSSRQMASSDSGADIFMRIKNGNGTFVTQAAAANTGSGVASVGSVLNPALATGHNYQIDFTVAAGVTTYSVTDSTTATVLSSGNAYVSGQAISFDGIQFEIKGAPANGDSFTVAPSTNESVFKTVSDMISALGTPIAAGSASGSAQLNGNLTRGIRNLDNALNNILTTRASLGLRLSEIDALQSSGDDLGLQYKQSLSQLQDVDYIKAISDLTQQKTYLEAAQQSFVKVSSLSLFNYL
jgi:flagellar hook-associated protein 3 FlgL